MQLWSVLCTVETLVPMSNPQPHSPASIHTCPHTQTYLWVRSKALRWLANGRLSGLTLELASLHERAHWAWQHTAFQTSLPPPDVF